MPQPTLTLGQPTFGSLDVVAEADIYEIVLTADVRYTFELKGAAGGSGLTLADPYVAVYDGAGNRLAFNDDSGPIGNNALLTFTPTNDGTYFVCAQASGNLGTGTYELIAYGGSQTQPDDDFTADLQTTGVALVNGAAAVGELQFRGDADWFRVAELTAGTTYTIELKGAATGSGTLADPLLHLRDADGNLLASNDDGGDGANSYLVYTPTATGAYFVSASAFGSSGTGSYAMSITSAAARDDHPGSADGAAQIQVGQPAQGELEAARDADWFAVRLAPGTTYAIEVKGSATASGTLADPVAYLYDADGEQLAFNDDGGTGSNALLTFRPTATTEETYYVSAQSYLGRGIGNYELLVTALAGEPEEVDDYPATAPGTVLPDGAPVAGDIEVLRDTDRFAIRLLAGTTYTIELKGAASGSGTLVDPYVRLYGGTTQVGANDDGPTKDSVLVYTPAADGDYVIEAGAWGGSGTGDYRIVVTAATDGGDDDYAAGVTGAGQVAIGQPARGELETARDDDWFAVRLAPGTTYTIELKGSATSSGTLADPVVYLYDADGQRLASNDDGGAGSNALLTYLPTASTEETYYISARSYLDRGTGDYEVLVTADTGEPGTSGDDYPATAPGTVLPDGTAVSGDIEVMGDTDRFAIRLLAGTTYTIELKGAASASGSLPDPFVRLFLGDTQVAFNDDAVTHDSLLVYTPTADGDYFIEAGAWGGRGTGDYRVVVSATTGGGGNDDYAAGVTGAGQVDVGQPETGELEAERDDDWFAVRLAPGTTYTIELRGSATSSGSLADPLVYLYDANGQQLASNDDGGIGANALLVYTPTVGTEETYYISARSYLGRGTGDYEIMVTATDGGSGPLDDYPAALPGVVEPDDAPVEGVIEIAGDTDRFNVSLEPGTTYTIELKGASSASGTLADPYLRLYNGNTQVASNDDGGTGSDALIVYTPTTDGNFLIEAGAWGGRGTGGYQVVVHAESEDSGNDDFGASPSKAGVVVVGGSVTGKLESAGDSDWFAVQLAAGTTYRIDLMGADSGGERTLADPFVYLHDAQGNRLASNDDAGIGKDAVLTFTTGPAATYYISARAFGDDLTGTYRLGVSVGTSGTPAEPEPEIPPDLSEAPPLSTGAMMLGTLRSTVIADWYAVTLDAEVPYVVALAGTSSSAGTLIDPRIFLHDENGEFLLSNDDGGSGLDAELVYTPLTGGTYYLSARAFGAADGSYKLKIGAGTPGEGPGPGDPDDTGGDATTLGRVVGGFATGNLETAGDTDWFGMSLTAGTTYRILLNGESSGSGTLADPVLRIYRANGTQAAINDDGGFETDAALVFTPRLDGTYYFSAGAFNGTATGTYELKVGATAASGPNPNDDWDSAPLSFTGSLEPGGVGNGVVEVPGDVDWFRIELTADTEYFFKLHGEATGLGTLADPFITVMDGSGKLLGSDDDAGTGRNAMLRFVPTASGLYYVGAQGFGGAGSYVVMASSSPGDGDDYAGDTSDRAGRTADNRTITGTIETAGDDDWFRIELTGGTTYTFSLNGADSWSGSLDDPSLRLYKLTGTTTELVAQDAASGGWGNNDRLEYTPAASGIYYISATAAGSDKGTYSLHVTSTDDFPENRSTVGEFSALASTAPAVVDTGVLEAAGDRDWFRAWLNAGELYTFKVSGRSSGPDTLANPSALVYGPNGRQFIAEQDSDAGPGSDEWVTFTATTAGYYFLSAGSGEGATGSYRVSGYAGDDYGSQYATMGSINPGEALIANLEDAGDRDWFFLQTKPLTQYWIHVRGRSTDAGTLADPLAGWLVGSESPTLLEVNDNASANTLDSFLRVRTGGSAGNIVEISSAQLGGTGTYEIFVTEDDFGDASGGHGVMSDGESIQGHIDDPTDHDWFQVILLPGLTYRFAVHGLDSETQDALAMPHLRLYNDVENFLSEDAGTGEAILTFSYEGIVPIAHYIGVSSDAGTGRYELTFESWDADRGIETPLVLVDGRGSGRIDFDGDEDWFRVSLEANVTYEFWGDGRETVAGSTLTTPVVSLHAPDGSLLASDSRSGRDLLPEGANAHFSFTPTFDGDFFVSLRSSNTETGAYKILVTSYDDQRGDSGSLGTLGENSSLAGAIERSGDVDWYRVRFNDDQVYAIWADGLATTFATLVNPTVKVYDLNGNEVAIYDASGPADNAAAFTEATLSGDYFVSVSSTSGSTGTYRLSVHENDDYQGNRATTGTLEMGAVQENSIGFLGDKDWFRVSLEEDQEYWFWLDGVSTGLGTLANASLSVHDRNGNEIQRQDGGGFGTSALLKFTPAADGDYFISAFGTNDASTGTYSLTMTPAGDIRGDRGTIDSLVLFQPAASDMYGPTDVDWFRITLSPGTQYTVWADGLSTASGTLVEPVVQLYDSLGAPVGAPSDGGGVGFNAALNVTTTTGTTYYVAVSSGDGTAGTYRLLATPRDDYQASSATAGVLTAAAPVTGRLDNDPVAVPSWGFHDDTDWFRVHLEPGQYYTFRATSSVVSNMDLTLYGPGGTNVVASASSDNGDNVLLSIEPEAGGDYFIAVDGSDDGAYQLTLTSEHRIEVGTPVVGSLDAAGESDRYVVWLDPKTYSFWLDGSSAGLGTLANPTLRLFDTSGDLVATYEGGGWDTNVAFQYGQAAQFEAGYYFMEVFSSTLNTGSYTLHVQDKDDLQGSRATAGRVNVGSTTFVSNAIERAGDTDWLRVSLQADKLYELQLNASGSDHRYTLGAPAFTLLDPAGNPIGGDVAADGGSYTLLYVPEIDGDYFLSVASADGGTGVYGVYAAERSFVNDMNPLATGFPIPGNLAYSASVNRYPLEVASGFRYWFSVEGSSTGSGSLSNPTMRLLSPDGNTVIRMEDGGGVGGNVSWAWDGTQEPGTYIVEVFSSNGATGSYAIQVDSTDDDVYPNSIDTEGRVTVDAPAAQYTLGYQETDWFRVTLEADTDYELTLHLGSFGGSPYSLNWGRIYLYDAEGDTLLAQGSTDTGTTLAFTPSASGDYYLVVAPLSEFSVGGTYGISASAPPPPPPPPPVALFSGAFESLESRLQFVSTALSGDLAQVRQQIQATTGESAYWDFFDPQRIVGGDDGWLTPDELGTSALGTVEATQENIESLYFGTSYALIRSVDQSEYNTFFYWWNANWQSYEAGDATVIQAYEALAAGWMAAETAAPYLPDSWLVETLKNKAVEDIQLLGAGGSLPMFDAVTHFLVP